MNAALFYRHHGRSIFWIAFMSALAIHLGALALATNKSPTTKLEHFIPPGDVEIVDAAEPEPAVEESVTRPPLEQSHPDEDTFPEENHKPPPIRAYHKARAPYLARGTTASLHSMKALVAYASRSTKLCR